MGCDSLDQLLPCLGHFSNFCSGASCRGQPRCRSGVLSPPLDFFLTVFAWQKNTSAGSSAGGALPAQPKLGKELSRTGVQPCFVSYPGACLGLGRDSLLLPSLAGVKTGHERKPEGAVGAGAVSGSPFAVVSGSSYACELPIFNVALGQAWLW